jgi:hypothetical protein
MRSSLQEGSDAQLSGGVNVPVVVRSIPGLPAVVARGWHGRQGGARFEPVGVGISLRAGRGQSSATTCLVGKGHRPAAAIGVRGSNPAPGCCAARCRSGEGRVSCGSCAPAVTAGALYGPGRPRSRLAPVLSGARLLRRVGPARPGAGSAAVPGSAGSRCGRAWRAGLLVCGWWPLGRVEEGPAAWRAAGDYPADWYIAADTANFRKNS